MVFASKHDFLNGIISLKTNLAPNEFLKNMQRLEKRLKRTRSFKDAPRTLDIDIIFFHDKKINTKKLTIPHKVLEPKRFCNNSITADGSFINIKTREKMKKKVMVGMSGGIDSSVTAYMLQEEGYEVEGVYLKLHNRTDGYHERNLGYIKDVAEFLNIKYHVIGSIR